MTEILVGDFVLVLLVFIRIFAMIMTAPIFEHKSFPVIAKSIVSLLLAYMTFMTIDKSSVMIDINLVSLILSAVKEVITGLLMGFMLNFVFIGIQYAGSFIGYDMGLMMAAVLNPFTETQNNVVGELIYFASMMVFIFINGHHYAISAVVASFKVVPIGKYIVAKPLLDLLIKYSFAIFTIALKIAAPMIVSYLLFHIAEAIIARSIPNIQIMMLTQPAKLGLGFVLLTILAPMYLSLIRNLLQNYEMQLSNIIKAMSV